MFTGIIETLAQVVSLQQEQNNITFQISSAITRELKIDQSVAHNGVCLTVTAIDGDVYSVTAVHETLQKTNLGRLKPGDRVNLERCMPANGRFDGHFVQGHVDQVGICTHVADEQGSWRYRFQYDPSAGNLTVEKGSVCVNGVSLTVVDSQPDAFSVAIIPYTYQHTNFHYLQAGDEVNLEFDILGKYLKKFISLHKF